MGMPSAETKSASGIWRAALVLTVFAVFGALLVAYTHHGTRDRIAQNERAFLLRSLNVIVPESRYDNDFFNDVIHVTDEEFLGTGEPIAIYRATNGGRPVAAILTPVAPNGYGGPIRLMVGINHNGDLAGVRVVSHKETPGLGDDIDVAQSDWIKQFTGLSLQNPVTAKWAVKRDGGDFDQFTGATITPRAVVKAVHNALIYFGAHRDELFSTPKEAIETE